MMLEFVCYFMPAFISLSIFNSLRKEKLDRKEFIVFFGIFTVLNNLLTLFMICIKHFGEILNFDKIGITYLFKYLLMSIVFSIVTPFIVSILNTNVRLRLEVFKSEKKKRKKK